MGTILASKIVDKAEIVLHDTGNVRWTAAELLDWLNEGQRAVVSLRPNAYVDIATVTCVAGPVQDLPADGARLIEVLYTVGGSATVLADREVITAMDPSWMTATPGTDATNYMFDVRYPTKFLLYPSVQAGVEVKVAYSKAPAEAATLGSAITLDDIYEPALVDYVLFRAFSKDTEFAGNDQLAGAHYGAFVQAITGKRTGDAEANPNTANPPYDVAERGVGRT